MATPILLIQRDVAILSMVHAFGGCTADQVAKRLFPSLRGPRMCYRRIAGLVHSGYLVGQRLPAATGVGSGKNFLTLTPRGRGVVAAAQGLGVKELPRSRAKSPRFIEHHLAIGDTRIAFELAGERSPAIRVSEWLVDRRTVIESTGPGEEAVTLVPDGAFTLTRGGASSIEALLEQDTGTLTNRARMRTRLLGYLRYTQTSPALVLFVTTTMARLASLVALALETRLGNGSDRRSIWFTTCQSMAAGNPLFGPIWQVPGNRTPVALAAVFGPSEGLQAASGGAVE